MGCGRQLVLAGWLLLKVNKTDPGFACWSCRSLSGDDVRRAECLYLLPFWREGWVFFFFMVAREGRSNLAISQSPADLGEGWAIRPPLPLQCLPGVGKFSPAEVLQSVTT